MIERVLEFGDHRAAPYPDGAGSFTVIW
jgi:hypothetical protein